MCFISFKYLFNFRMFPYLLGSGRCISLYITYFIDMLYSQVLCSFDFQTKIVFLFLCFQSVPKWTYFCVFNCFYCPSLSCTIRALVLEILDDQKANVIVLLISYNGTLIFSRLLVICF